MLRNHPSLVEYLELCNISTKRHRPTVIQHDEQNEEAADKSPFTPLSPFSLSISPFQSVPISIPHSLLPSLFTYSRSSPFSHRIQLRGRPGKNLSNAILSPSGVAIGCARRAVHAGPSFGGGDWGRRTLCGRGELLNPCTWTRFNLATPLLSTVSSCLSRPLDR